MRKFYLVYRDRDEKIIQSLIGQLRIPRDRFAFRAEQVQVVSSLFWRNVKMLLIWHSKASSF